MAARPTFEQRRRLTPSLQEAFDHVVQLATLDRLLAGRDYEQIVGGPRTLLSADMRSANVAIAQGFSPV
jgi:hypothetical protein